MSFNRKVIIFCALFLAITLYVAYRYYRVTHPRYIPLPPREEVSITVIPGWNLRQVAEHLVDMGLAKSLDEVYDITGVPAMVRSLRAGPPTPDLMDQLDFVARKPGTVSYEGYLAPETYRVFKDAPLTTVIGKLLAERDTQFKDLVPGPDAFTKPVAAARGEAPVTFHDLVTMASIIEKETRHPEDQMLVSDILWRRFSKGWALQVDSSVHYAVDRTGDVFTTDQERAIDSPWNTYKYPGLPPGPISNPGISSLRAAFFPKANEYWYFLTGNDGVMYYAKTLDEHNLNRARYLR